MSGNNCPVYRKFEYFLRIIQKHRKDKIQFLLKAANDKVIKGIVEIAYNLLKGDIPLTKVQISKLRENKKIIKYLINKKVSLKKKRLALYENPDCVKVMLRIVLN